MMKKVLLGLMVVLAAAFLFTSCASKTEILKKAVEKAKQEMGIPKTQNGVTIKDIAFDPATNTINYISELPAEQFPAFKFMATQPVYKDFVIYSCKDDSSMKALADLLVSAKGALVLTYEVQGGGDSPVVFSYNDAILKQLVDGTIPQPDMSQLQQPQPQAVSAEEAGMTMEEGAGAEMEEGAEE